MRRRIFVLGVAISLFVGSAAISSCSSNSGKAAKQEQTAEVYACPMHPEVTGKKGDKCSKCGMYLTKVESSKEHQEHTHKE